MMKVVLLFVLTIACVCAFRQMGTISRSRSTIVMGTAPKPSGFCSTREGKEKILARTKSLLSTSSMVITVPFEGVSKEQTDMLRKSLPEEVTASIVKNSLMKLSIVDTPFAVLAKDLKEENLFFFIPEGKAKPSYEAFKKWQKEIKRQEPEQQAKTLVTDGQAFTGKELEYVTSLPTKEELITKIAIGIKMPTQKIAMAVKAVPAKLGRAF
ncbi:hypothetical protein B484DRAFT_365660, partial [Ochromonadaceae sp. CCMP2298]